MLKHRQPYDGAKLYRLAENMYATLFWALFRGGRMSLQKEKGLRHPKRKT